MDIGEMISGLIQSGGAATWLLLVLALVAVVVTIERLVALSRASIDINDFLAKVRHALLVNRSPREAIKVCEQYRGPVPSIIKAGLLKYGQPDDGVEKTIENAALFERGRLERFLPVLATIARVAPLLGLLATVIGLIEACDAVAAAGTADPRLIAPEIRQALLPAAGGLLLAIPLHVVHGWFASRVSKFTRDHETATNMLLETLGEMARAGGAPEAAGAEPAREAALR